MCTLYIHIFPYLWVWVTKGCLSRFGFKSIMVRPKQLWNLTSFSLFFSSTYSSFPFVLVSLCDKMTRQQLLVYTALGSRATNCSSLVVEQKILTIGSCPSDGLGWGEYLC